MREHPILFSAPMILAILDGRKTQTRRVIKQQPHRTTTAAQHVDSNWWEWKRGGRFRCPYGQPGDRLWVRETWRPGMHPEWLCAVQYRADLQWLKPTGLDENTGYIFADWCDREPQKWSPSIHMPRWASRITLEITGVRVERLQAISDADARAEGVTATPAISAYRNLWNTINAQRGYCWESNPWVWVLEFNPWKLAGTNVEVDRLKSMPVGLFCNPEALAIHAEKLAAAQETKQQI